MTHKLTLSNFYAIVMAGKEQFRSLSNAREGDMKDVFVPLSVADYSPRSHQPECLPSFLEDVLGLVLGPYPFFLLMAIPALLRIGV